MYIQIKATETQVPRPGNPEAKLWASEHHLLILGLAAPHTSNQHGDANHAPVLSKEETAEHAP